MKILTAIIILIAASVTVMADGYKLDATGLHAGKMTRDKDAILTFSPVGVWAVPENDTKFAPTVAFMYLYPDGTLTMLRATDCRLMGTATWEIDHTLFVLTDAFGDKSETVMVGVPGKRYEQDDGSVVYGWGQRILFGTGRYWAFLSPNVESEC